MMIFFSLLIVFKAYFSIYGESRNDDAKGVTMISGADSFGNCDIIVH